MMAVLAVTSWETIARRTLMMAQGRCSAAEYQRMVQEKVAAAQQSAAVLMRSQGQCGGKAVLAPWLRRTRANAKRLRRK